MAWDFSTEPEFEEQLAWMRQFVRDEIFPLETLDLDPRADLMEAIKPLQERGEGPGPVGLPPPPRARAAVGFGQVKLGLMHEILGQTPYGPVVFGNNAPDSGNAELLAIGIESSGRDEQRERWLQPLLDGTHAQRVLHDRAGGRGRPDHDRHHGGPGRGRVGDRRPQVVHLQRLGGRLPHRDGVTNPDVHPYAGCSMIVVPADTPGVDIVRDVATMEDPVEHFGKFGGHAEIIYREVRVPVREPGRATRARASVLAQKRLGPGRIHHCMRWLGQSQRAFDMLCERAVSRTTHDSLLAEKQTIQNWVADSLAEMTAARLMTLYAAWKMDERGGLGGPGGDRHDQVLRRRRALQRDRPGHPGPRGPRASPPTSPSSRCTAPPGPPASTTAPTRSTRSPWPARPSRATSPVEVPTEHVPTRRAEAVQRFAHLLDVETADR